MKLSWSTLTSLNTKVSNESPFDIHGTKLPKEDAATFLCFILDKKVTWKKHVVQKSTELRI